MFNISHIFAIIFLSTFLLVSLADVSRAKIKNGNYSILIESVNSFQPNPILKRPTHLVQKKNKKQRMGKKKKSKKRKGQLGNNLKTCAICENLEGYVPAHEIHDDIRKLVGKYQGGGGKDNVRVQRERGIFETGLFPVFIRKARCPEIDSEKWAIDYTFKRGKAALHRGVDIPQPRGTPIRAVADGTIVGRFLNKGRKDGIAVFLRHTPEQTGLPFWSYSHYTHLLKMSPLPVGRKVKMGEEIGKTSNSGKMGRRVRRDALHFAIFYSTLPEWSNDGSVVVPKDGHAMDPNAFYRATPPYDTLSMLGLPKGQKGILVPYMRKDNTFVPSDTKRIWPYPCD